jgi:hypothetical protein
MALLPATSHTVVLFKSVACGHCTKLSEIWDKPPAGEELSVTAAIRKVYPTARFSVVTARDNTGLFDENTAPKDLIRYGKWFPMILLVPGWLWDKAMEKLGPKNPVELINGVIPLNGKWFSGKLVYEQKYDIRKPSEFARWVQESLASEDFKKYASPPNVIPNFGAPIAPVPIAPAPIVQSAIISPIATPTVQSVPAPVVHSSSSHQEGEMTAVNKVIASGSNGNVCGMRIIPRPTK